MALTQQRAVSYWAVYNRMQYPVLRPRDGDRWPRYPAFTLLDAISGAGQEPEGT